VNKLDAALCRPIPADNAALRLLTHYIGILDETDTLATDAQRHAVAHVHDLVALALGATRDGAEIAKARGARAARLRVIKDDIGSNLARDDLSVATVAARHRLAVRYVQRLFEAEGVTFTEYVLEARLACVHRMLRDPRLAHVKIGTVACDAGFGDPSYFNGFFAAATVAHRPTFGCKRSAGIETPHAAFFFSAIATRVRRIRLVPLSRCSGLPQSSKSTTRMSGRTFAAGPSSRM